MRARPLEDHSRTTEVENQVSELEEFIVRVRIWIERGGKTVLGKGGAQILRAIHEKRSIASAARELGMSYKYVWSYINKIQRNSGLRIVQKRAGGATRGRPGGGETTLTKDGERLLALYKEIREHVIGGESQILARGTALTLDID